MQTQEYLAPVWTHLTRHQIVRGQGIYLYDAHGQEYIDFTSGIGVVNTGHCHPRVVERIQQQAAQLLFGQINCVVADTTVQLAAKLAELCPPHINRFFFANSGAEATEAAVKLAKQATGRPNIVVMQGSFHGRTHLTMAMTTSKTVYRHQYNPLPAGIYVAPAPYAYFYGWDETTTVDYCQRQLQHLLLSQTAPDETAAIVVEPVLGEGGYVPLPASYLHFLRRLCDEHGILLVIDEVQSGFGRTGKFFCFEHAQVRPDILIMAKGLGSGLPISAIGASEELMQRWTPGTHGGTYGGGSAIAAAAACATIDTLLDENLIGNAQERGQQLMLALRQLQQLYPIMGDVRGVGLMVAVEFGPSGQPDAKACQAVIEACLQRGLLLLSCGTYKNVVRWIPPLVVSAQQMEHALSIFEDALKSLNA